MFRQRLRPIIIGLGGLALVAGTATASTIASAEPEETPESDLPRASELDYVAEIDVVPAADDAEETSETVSGTVFNDRNMDGVQQEPREHGIPGVLVSNGREVVETDADGSYELPAYDDMSVFVTKPNDWALPTDADNVPQMAYEHKPAGSPPLRFGGLEPTGPLPEAINFPMVRTQVTDQFDCAVMGDTQPYSNNEVSYVRDSVAKDLQAVDRSDAECMLLAGDVMGDDLDLLPRFKQMMSSVDLPQYYVHGNHDYDFDATDDADSADTWRREYGPSYYSFDIGQVHFVVLDNVVYPCTEEDDLPDNCGDPDNPAYNGRITDDQMEWLANDLDWVPADKLIVLSHHIPFLSFVDNEEQTHQTDNAADVYELLAEREALSLSGHTHTLEQLLPGESYAGWEDTIGIDEVPFHHIVTGAPSGSWYSGDLDWDGVPMSLGRLGEPRGYFMIEFDGADYSENYHATGHPTDRQMWLSFNSPQYREWFDELRSWTEENPPTADDVPPVNINDLEDTKLFTPTDLDEGVFLTANVWNGSRDSDVSVTIDDGDPIELTRTQDGDGEEVGYGEEYSDPYSVVRQLQTARYGFESGSGNERAQGWEQNRGTQYGPASPQSVQENYIAEKSSHVWRAQLPSNLEIGAHVAEVTSVDRYGQEFTEEIVFEVLEERPPRFWRTEPWEDEDGNIEHHVDQRGLPIAPEDSDN